MSPEQKRDFHQAAGECFSEAICPPVADEDVSSHECCEVLWERLGDNFTTSELALLSKDEKKILTCAFADYFECEAPSIEQIETAIEWTIARCPLDDLRAEI